MVDQLLHLLWGFGIVWIAMHHGMKGAFAAVTLPVLALLPRELVDQFDGWWHIGDGKMLDIICYGLGGLGYYKIRRYFYGNTKRLHRLY